MRDPEIRRAGRQINRQEDRLADRNSVGEILSVTEQRFHLHKVSNTSESAYIKTKGNLKEARELRHCVMVLKLPRQLLH